MSQSFIKLGLIGQSLNKLRILVLIEVGNQLGHIVRGLKVFTYLIANFALDIFLHFRLSGLFQEE